MDAFVTWDWRHHPIVFGMNGYAEMSEVEIDHLTHSSPFEPTDKEIKFVSLGLLSIVLSIVRPPVYELRAKVL